MRPNTEADFWRRVAKACPNDCWPWTGGRSSRGYGTFSWGNRNLSTHRMAWTFTWGPVPAGLYVCHQCDNPPCCNPRHLFLAPPAVNSADMVTKGRALGHPGPLPAEIVRELRRRYAAGGVSTHQLAAEFGLSSMAVWRIVTGKSYREVD